ncbi:MAG: hypothetical protein ACI9KS_000636 [Sulfitobacter sp.]|jgi:hypothetical protein
MSGLDDALLAAHAADDRAGLVTLYTQAADQANAVEATSFYLTHAYVFALEAGMSQASALKTRLVAMGRETE